MGVGNLTVSITMNRPGAGGVDLPAEGIACEPIQPPPLTPGPIKPKVLLSVREEELPWLSHDRRAGRGLSPLRGVTKKEFSCPPSVPRMPWSPMELHAAVLGFRHEELQTPPMRTLSVWWWPHVSP